METYSTIESRLQEHKNKFLKVKPAIIVYGLEQETGHGKGSICKWNIFSKKEVAEKTAKEDNEWITNKIHG